MDQKRRVSLLLSARSLAGGGGGGGVGVGGGAEDMPDPHQHQPPGPGYGRLPPAADTKAQALPGVYIVHAAPLFPVQLHGETVAPKKAGPDYKWSSRMSPPGPRSKDPDNELPNWRRRLSARVSAAEERSTSQSVEAEVGASVAARLRSKQTSPVDSRLSSGTSGHGPGHGPGHGSAPLEIRNGAQRPGYDDSLGEEIFRNMRKTLMPMTVIFVVYGLVPVQFKPLRVSAHPLRSTLLYVVVIQACVALSAHHVLSSYSGLLQAQPQDARGVDERLLAIFSIVHVSAVFIIFLFYGELRNACACQPHLNYFVKNFGHMVGPLPFCFWTRCLPWFSAVFTFVLAPVMMYVWTIRILKADLLEDGPAHHFVLIAMYTIASYHCLACNVVKDFASAVASALREELDAGCMTASRLEEFRLAWISLRQLTVDLGTMPLTGLAMLLLLLVMTTLCAYQFAVSYYNNYTVLFFSSSAILALLQFGLTYTTDVAHRVKEAMSTGFSEPLESKSWRDFPPDLLAEHQQFLHTISMSPAEISYAGIVTITRSTYLSIMAAIATYLIVLFQLRMADEDPPTTPLPSLNATYSSLDSVFRSRN